MLKFKRYSIKNKIYGYQDACGFGDIWALTSYLLRVSEESGKPTHYFSRNQRQKEIMQSIVPHLKSKGKIVFSFKPTERLLGYCEPFLLKLVPTKRTWKYNGCARVVAYQFDGVHLADEKNLPLPRLIHLLRSLTNQGFIPIDVGHHKPLSFIVDTLAKCKFFVGCPSGLSVAAMSVGCPIMLITRKIKPAYLGFMKRCQYNTSRRIEMYMTVDEFLIRSRQLGRMGRLL